MSKPNPNRSECPECGRMILVRANGALRHHVGRDYEYPGAIWRKVCDGSGRFVIKAVSDA